VESARKENDRLAAEVKDMERRMAVCAVRIRDLEKEKTGASDDPTR